MAQARTAERLRPRALPTAGALLAIFLACCGCGPGQAVGGPPSITFTTVPAFGRVGDFGGTVSGLEAATRDSSKLAFFIYVPGQGWWNKPTDEQRLVDIGADGSWSADLITGGIDQMLTRVAAFLVPADYTPPLVHGDASLPQELSQHALASAIRERQPKEIEFSGRTWWVKHSDPLIGPGPNYFSDSTDNVRVDDDGRLHLRITNPSGRWTCAEVVSQDVLGYGKYVFQLATRVDLLDANVVAGLFTYDETIDSPNREIDIEFSRWGDPLNQNGQYVVSPWDQPGHIHRFEATLRGDQATHCFVWRAGGVSFQSLHGRQACPGAAENEIASWSYVGADTPPAGQGNARINLWLYNGAPPTDGQPAEVIIDGFEFVPE
jgi:hypothetical protein